MYRYMEVISWSWMLEKGSSLRQSKKSACFMEESSIGSASVDFPALFIPPSK
jgi:hypothetical protein